MRLRKEFFEGEIKCPSCNYETSVGFSLDGENWYCGNCIADIISEDYIVAEKDFNPDDYPTTYFPNWYEKEYFEDIYGEELTDEEMMEIIEELRYSSIPDEVSEMVYELLPDLKEIRERLK